MCGFRTCIVEGRLCRVVQPCAVRLQPGLVPTAAQLRLCCSLGWAITFLWEQPETLCSCRVDRSRQWFLPGVNGAGYGVVAMVHGVWSPAVAPHAFRVVVSGHSQVLKKVIHYRKDTWVQEGEKRWRRRMRELQDQTSVDEIKLVSQMIKMDDQKRPIRPSCLL